MLTHAHIDHSGLLPKLVRDGFTGAIHATPADGGPVRRHAARQRAHSGDGGAAPESPPRPLERRTGGADLRRRRRRPHDGADAGPRPKTPGCRCCRACSARFWNAGHMLGSASSRWIAVAGDRDPLRLLFSGDIGPAYKLLHPDPEGPQGVDYLICESTYGGTDRAHHRGRGPPPRAARRGPRRDAPRRRDADPLLRGRTRAGTDRRPHAADATRAHCPRSRSTRQPARRARHRGLSPPPPHARPGPVR